MMSSRGKNLDINISVIEGGDVQITISDGSGFILARADAAQFFAKGLTILYPEHKVITVTNKDFQESK
jgi:hypothetical protein